ncbi:MAG: hypothetical protein AABZ35_05435 [Gemmatimonadota bacterium]
MSIQDGIVPHLVAEVRTVMQRWMLAGRSSMMLVLLGTRFAVLRR